jgi:hypothetical protein
MLCNHYGHTWEILLAHIVHTANGYRELVPCPKCGSVESFKKGGI